jgi:tetratricopeptide (TPR) repeat protein
MLCKTSDTTTRRLFADRAIAEFFRLSEINALERNERMPSQDKIDQYILTLLLDSQQPEKALSHLSRRLQRNPNDLGTMTMMSDICVDLGRLSEAIEWREKCLAMKPWRAEAHYAVGVFAWRLSKENKITGEARQALIDRGLRALERARELGGDHFETLTFINLLYREKAKYETLAKRRTQLERLADQYQTLARELFESGRQEARLLEPTSPNRKAEH